MITGPVVPRSYLSDVRERLIADPSTLPPASLLPIRVNSRQIRDLVVRDMHRKYEANIVYVETYDAKGNMRKEISSMTDLALEIDVWFQVAAAYPYEMLTLVSTWRLETDPHHIGQRSY